MLVSGEQLSYTRSTIIESPMPPEMHSVASPTVLLWAASAVDVQEPSNLATVSQ